MRSATPAPGRANDDMRRETTVKLARTIAAACYFSGLWAFGAQAAVIGGIDYDSDVEFGGINSSVFDPGGQLFRLGGALGGWDVRVTGAFSDPDYLSTWNAGTDAKISSTNLSPTRFQNPAFPEAKGLFFRRLTDTSSGENITVNFSMQFTNDPSYGSLQMAVFNGESVDSERDTITHSGGVYNFVSSENLTSVTGNGTSTMTFTDSTNQPGVGQFIATTVVNSGDTLGWQYDFLKPATRGGANMIAFAASSSFAAPPPALLVSAVPVPMSAVLLISAISGAAFVGRRRSHR